jgi:transposase
MRKRQKYTKEFKESALELYRKNSNEKTAKDVAEALGVHPENLRRWLRESEEGETKNIRVFPGQGNPRDEEVALLKRRVADLEETNEILKKAMAFFVVKNPR